MRTNFLHHARAVLLTGGAQAVVQLVGLLAGILVIRLLTLEEYAYYTIANTALGAMTVLADGGIGNGVLAQGGKVWHDPAKLGAVISAGLALRRQFALVVAILALPLTGLLLAHQGAGWWQAGMVAAAILPLFFLTVTTQLLEAVPRLHQNLLPLQLVQVAANLGRLAALGLILPILPLAMVATLIAALPQGWANWRLRHLANQHADWRKSGDAEAREHLISQVRRTLPGAIYYAVSGQLTVWLIAVFGDASSVASVGALSRLGMVLGVLSGVFAVIAVPRFARIPTAEERRVRNRYWQAQCALLTICVLPIAALALASGPVLSILGPSYIGLEREAVLMAFGSAAGILCGAAFVLGAARGVVAPPWVAIPYSVLGQVVLLLVLPLNTVAGVIWFGLAGSANLWLFHVGYFIWNRRASTLIRLS